MVVVPAATPAATARLPAPPPPPPPPPDAIVATATFEDAQVPATIEVVPFW